MRIVHSIPNFGLGGIQKAGCVLAKHMAAMGHHVTLIGETTGPRMAGTRETNPAYVIAGQTNARNIAAAIRDAKPDVIHLHAAEYDIKLLKELQRIGITALSDGGPLLVTTPVFGRPPEPRNAIRLTKTCCVGLYTLYRLCRWMGVSPRDAIYDLGAFYVPLTPYDPPKKQLFATDDDRLVRSRRHDLGVPADTTIVIGRIGRNSTAKWHPRTEQLIGTLLESDPKAAWVSVGLPAERGEQALRSRWGARFINLPETADYQSLTTTLSAMDLQIFFSSYGECFASSICEAAGTGVPTVALATPLNDNGQAEQVIDGVTGILVNSIDSARKAVAALSSDKDALTRLKRSTMAYAHERWHSRRSTEDLLCLYNHWLSKAAHSSFVLERILDELECFSSTYRQRMLGLMAGDNPFQRLDWRLRLSAVESFTAFRIARTARRCHRTFSRIRH